MNLAGLAGLALQADSDSEGTPARDEDLVDDVNNVVDDIGDFLWGTGGRILLILLIAAVVHVLVRRAIARFARRVIEPDAAQKLSGWRTRAPSVVAKSSMLANRAAARAHTLAQVLRSIATAVIWTIAFVMILGEAGYSLGPLIAGAGIAGVALGFGAQSLVKDFLTGFFMLVEDQCGVGDFVDLGEATGVVEAVSLRTTRVRDLNGTLWHIPNGTIERVGNLSQEWSRAVMDLSVAYGTDLDHAQRVIKETADALWHDPDWAGVIVEEPEVWGIEEFTADAITIRLVVKTEPASQWRVMRELRQRMWHALKGNDIEIPFAQRTVWLHQETDSPD